MPTAGRASHYFAVFVLVLLSARASSSRDEILQKSRAGAHKDKGRLVPNFHDLNHCTDKKHYLIMTDIVTELNNQGEELWTVGYNLSQATKSFQIFRVVIHRCSLNTDKCEYWNTWSWDLAICSLLFVNNTVWAPLVQSITPKFSCPIQTGHYTAVNSTLDFDSVVAQVRGSVIVPERNTWRIEVQLYNEQRSLFLCFHVLAKLIRVKART